MFADNNEFGRFGGMVDEEAYSLFEIYSKERTKYDELSCCGDFYKKFKVCFM
jgi:hypothetical protein